MEGQDVTFYLIAGVILWIGALYGFFLLVYDLIRFVTDRIDDRARRRRANERLRLMDRRHP